MPEVVCNMILLEINEFNPGLLQKAADKLELKNLKRLCEFSKTETESEEKEERFGLDPWVQWPSIHTGTPASKHGLYHLADAYRLKEDQIWDVLSKNGQTCGVWGAMNAKLNSKENIAFYFPDPWTYTELAYPSSLNRLLALPRYYAQHYLSLSTPKLIGSFLKTASFFLNPILLGKLFSSIPLMISRSRGCSINNALLFSLFDLINAITFSYYCRRNLVDFKLIFLNSVAHCQHHCWAAGDELSPEMQALFRLLDESVGVVLSTAKEGEAILVVNAFSQYCSIDENKFLYRQADPVNFFSTIGIQADCEQLMTNDSQLIFETKELAVEAFDKLQGFMLLGKNLFQVERDPEDERRLFCQVLVWDDVPAGEKFHNKELSVNFYDHFEKVVKRSGSHDAKGVVLSNIIKLPDKMFNYHLYNYILEYYGIQ